MVEIHQFELFGSPRRRSHRDDPETSRRAERKARARFMRGHARAVLDLVRNQPGLTASEIASALAADDFARDEHRRLCQVRRRLSDLKAGGAVDRIAQPGADEATWFPVICNAAVGGRAPR